MNSVWGRTIHTWYAAEEVPKTKPSGKSELVSCTCRGALSPGAARNADNGCLPPSTLLATTNTINQIMKTLIMAISQLRLVWSRFLIQGQRITSEAATRSGFISRKVEYQFRCPLEFATAGNIGGNQSWSSTLGASNSHWRWMPQLQLIRAYPKRPVQLICLISPKLPRSSWWE